MAASSLAYAEQDPRSYLGVSVGATITDDSDYDTGPLVQVLIGKPLSDRVTIEPSLTYTNVDVQNLAASEDYKRLTLGLDARAMVWGNHEHSTYVVGGLNGHQIDFLQEELSGYGGSLGFGMLNRLGRHLELRTEIRYSLDEISGEGIVPDDSFYTYGILAGVNYRFGIWPPEPVYDTDGDGVSDKNDRCPNTAKGVMVSSDGCPLDSDGDGVANHIDQCPNTPPNTPVNQVGCALDSDGDGVTDAKDQCPNTPPNTPVNSVGCALDSDQDGVPNSIDQCPNTPLGTAVDATGCSIDKDRDGVLNTADYCPNTYKDLQVDQRGCAVKEQTLTVHNIHFNFDRATLMPDSITLIRDMAATLKEQPALTVTVAGHADSLGDAAYNKRLSARRAQSVVNQLVAEGVSRTRLQFVGYGESRPVATNATEEGRALNRRVEFIIK